MKKFMSRVHLTYGIYISLLCCTFTKGQTAPNVTGIGGETTLFTCPSPTITPGGSYVLLKNSVPIYDETSDGRIIDGKYNATAGNGEIKLLILNTNISDAGTYTCSHNFVQTSGYVSVAFRPENITTVTTMVTDGWQLTVTATKVFPNDSAISSVICLKPDNANLPFGPVGQSVNPNSDIPYLFDIYWNGTITEHLSGQVQCTITLVTIETLVRTIVVSFQDSTHECSPWCECNLCECIIAIIMALLGGIGGCIAVAIYYSWSKGKCCFKKEEIVIPANENGGIHSGRSAGTGNRVLSTTDETLNETSHKTNLSRTTVHVDNQVNDETRGRTTLPPLKGNAKVVPEKDTAGQITEVINSHRPLPKPPEIDSEVSRQAPNMDDVEANKQKKKKKKKRKETKKEEIV